MILFLGFMDLLSALIFIITYFYTNPLFLIFPIYLILKSLIYIKSIVSIIDIIAAIFLIIAIFNGFIFLDWIFVIWLTQKALFSFLS